MCPQCSYPITQSQYPSLNLKGPQPTVTIERTSKEWKGLIAVAWLTISVGILFMFMSCVGEGEPNGTGIILGIVLVAVGFIAKWRAEIGRWWENE